jgi:Swt1-like HEPN
MLTEVECIGYVGKALDVVRDGLAPFLQAQLKRRRPDTWRNDLSLLFIASTEPINPEIPPWDPYHALKALTSKDLWESVFKFCMSSTDRGYAFELSRLRNKQQAHGQIGTAITAEDAHRSLDNAVLLLTAIGAREQAAEAIKFRGTVRRAIAHQEEASTDEDTAVAKRISFENRAVRRGINHALLLPFLSWYYNEELWHPQHGEEFPAVVYPLERPEDAKNSPVLAPWNSGNARAILAGDLACPDREFVARRKKSARQMRNRQTYCVREIVFERDAPIIKSDLIGNYDDCLATCDALEAELLIAMGSRPPASAAPKDFRGFAKSSLPLREAATSFARERGLSSYMTGAGRSAAIAVSTLTLAKRPDGSFVTFLGPRSGRTAVHSNLLHVAPSGMLQPIVDWQRPSAKMDHEFYKTEWSLFHHVLQEIAEEIFGRDCENELVDQLTETPGAIFEYPEIGYLENLLLAGDAQLFVTGVVVNLLNLRPEIATCLVINNSDWYTNHSRVIDGLPKFQRNWEFKNRAELKTNDPPDFWHTTVWTPSHGDVSNIMLNMAGGATFKNFVLPGAITLLLGLKFVARLLPTLSTG